MAFSGITLTADLRRKKVLENGPGMHNFDASTMNFGEVVQHTRPLIKHYWHYLIPPSGPASGQEGAGNWSPAAKVGRF